MTQAPRVSLTNGWMDKWMDGRTDGRTDGWMDGWMEGRMVVLLDGFKSN